MLRERFVPSSGAVASAEKWRSASIVFRDIWFRRGWKHTPQIHLDVQANKRRRARNTASLIEARGTWSAMQAKRHKSWDEHISRQIKFGYEGCWLPRLFQTQSPEWLRAKRLTQRGAKDACGSAGKLGCRAEKRVFARWQCSSELATEWANAV